MNAGDFLKYMHRAIELARRASGKTSPNPVVGCVIVKGEKVIAEGWHKRCGMDHAEVDALKKAGPAARGATMFVTLEPCSHTGKTPPCVDAILKAGIRRVVAAMKDPNPVNNGRSFRLLKAQGVDVMTGIAEAEARAMNLPFIKVMTLGMPYVIAKVAQGLDGRTVTPPGRSKWITAPGTRAWARKKRDLVDAILVGVNTVIADDPALDAPSKKLKKVVLDSRLRVSEKARIFRITAPEDIFVVTTKAASLAKIKRLVKRGVKVLVAPAKAGRVDLKWTLRQLASAGINSILIEGGAVVVASALKQSLVDVVHLYIAPAPVGGRSPAREADGLTVQKIARTLKFEITDIARVAPDAFIELRSSGLRWSAGL
jgi:diaminohydroxyphosphoribosylaminopyrimidine deaminase/5-amino-6-(5-phosphoribosylamino)uracil reductase